MRRFGLIVPLCVAMAACGPKAAQVTASPAPATAPAQAAMPEAIRWVRASAEHSAAFYQAYRLATSQLEQAASGKRAGAWGVVLDADETILDNSLYQLERSRLGLGYSADSWNAWVKRREATALPGAASFLSRVRALGGKIAVVTNRLGSECDDTRAVFEKLMLLHDAMLCRADGTPSDKNPRFEAVASGQPFGTGPIEIVMFLGDNIQDFPKLAQGVRAQGAPAFTDFGVRYFLLPNPMYGSWQ